MSERPKGAFIAFAVFWFLAWVIFANGVLFAEESNLFLLDKEVPLIDGEMDEVWDKASWEEIEKQVQGSADFQGDLSAAYKTLCTEEAIFLFVRVEDDIKNNNSGIDFYFEDDSISLFFDMGNDLSPIVDEDDYQLSFVYRLAGVYSREMVDTSSIEHAWKDLEEGYILEVKIPSQAFGDPVVNPDFVLNPGRAIGFDILVTDNDDKSLRDCLLAWSGDDRNYTQSDRLGQWYVAEGPVIVKREAEESVHHGLGEYELQGQRFLEASANDSGEASFFFEGMAPGVYSLWAKVSGKDNRSNALYLAIDKPYSVYDAEIVEFNPSEDFYWLRLNEELVFEDEYDGHRVTFGGREKYAKLDKIILINDGNAVFKALTPPVISEVSFTFEGIEVCIDGGGEGTEEFALERRIGQGAFEEITRVPAEEKQIIDQGVSPYEHVSYRVRSCNGYDSSAYSKVSYLNYGMPSEPENLEVSRERINRFRLSWEPGSENISGYIIERRVNNREYEEIARVDAHKHEYTDRIHISEIIGDPEEDEDDDDEDDDDEFWRWFRLFCKLRLYYRIRAYNSSGCSKYTYPVLEEDLIEAVSFSNQKSDLYITSELKENEYLYQDNKNEQTRFTSLPDYLKGTSFLRGFYVDSDLDEREYLSFRALKSIRVYLAVEHDSDVNDSVWSLKQQGVAINPHYYPNGVDIYTRRVRKDEIFTLSGNRSFTHAGNIFLLFFEQDIALFIGINFGPEDTEPIEGYDLDWGETYSLKSSGLIYGWEKDARACAVDRSRKGNALRDTYIEIKKGNSWRITLPDGIYRVRLSLGDKRRRERKEVKINGRTYTYDVRNDFDDDDDYRDYDDDDDYEDYDDDDDDEGDDDDRSIGRDPFLLIEDTFVISSANDNTLSISRGRYAAKLNYIVIERVDDVVVPIGVSDDTFISGARTWHIYGRSKELIVRDFDKKKFREKIALLEFPLKKYHDVERASLKVFLKDRLLKPDKESQILLYAVNGYDFNEETLNWRQCELVKVNRRGQVLLSEEAVLVDVLHISGDEEGYHSFEITDYLAEQQEEVTTFLMLFEKGSRDEALFFSKEMGFNPPHIEIVTQKKEVVLEGYLTEPSSGEYHFTTPENDLYLLGSYLIDLSEYRDLNVRIKGYFDPEYKRLHGEEKKIIVTEIEIIPPPVAPVLEADYWNNTGYPNWKWNRPAGATLFRYRLDELSWVETESTSFTPSSPLSEGEHTLILQCRNRLSPWSEAVEKRVKVDLTSPEVLEVTYTNPTNDQTPSFEWKAEDNFTSVRELIYEYRIDEYDWQSSIHSSYTSAYVLDEGFHYFQIRARDLAGNWSEPSVFEIEIDITPPQEVTNARIHYSEEGAWVLWDDSVSVDVDYYIIDREPAIEVAGKVVPGIGEFNDGTVSMLDEATYVYTIRGVDKATNVSAGAQASDGKEMLIDPADGVVEVLDHRQVSIYFADGITDAAFTARIKETAPPDVTKPGIQQIGPVYHFGPDGIEFKAPVMIQFSYEDSDLDRIEDEDKLSIFYFDISRCRWVKLPTVVDRANNHVFTFTNHFSEYSLQVDTSDAYGNEGINPFGEYYSNMNEHISESSGDLTLAYTLARLAGVRGNELELTLLYSSSDAVDISNSQISRTKSKIDKKLSDYYQKHKGDLDDILAIPDAGVLPNRAFSLGNGWYLDIPHIVNSTVYLSGGVGYSLNLGQEVHSGIHFRADRIGKEIHLVLKNGYTYIFDGSSYFASTTAEGGTKDWVADYFAKLKAFNEHNAVTKNELDKIYSYAFNTWNKKGDDWNYEPTNRFAYLTRVIDPFGNTTYYAFKNNLLTISNGHDSIEYNFNSHTVRCAGIEQKALLEFEQGRLKKLKVKEDQPAGFLDTEFHYQTNTLTYGIGYHVLVNAEGGGKEWEKRPKTRSLENFLISEVVYPSNARTLYQIGSAKKESQHKYRYTVQKVYNREDVLEKEVEFTREGGFNQISKTVMATKNREGIVEREEAKYYSIFGNMYLEELAGRETRYEYYNEPELNDRLLVDIVDDDTFSCTFVGKNNVFKAPGSGISVTTDKKVLIGDFIKYKENDGNEEIRVSELKVNLAGSNDICIKLTPPWEDYKKKGDLLLVTGNQTYKFLKNDLIVYHGDDSNNENIILYIKADKIVDATAGYMSKDPLKRLINYRGNDLYLVLLGDKKFELVYRRYDSEEQKKRNRIKKKEVNDFGLTYHEQYDYDGWGNTVYEREADGHQIFSAYHPVSHDQLVERVESRSTGVVYADKQEVIGAGNYNRTEYLFDGQMWAPSAMKVSDESEVRVTDYAYNPDGTISRKVEPGNRITDYTYNEKGLLETTTVHGRPPYSLNITTTHTYNDLNLIKSETVGDRTTLYEYDVLGRLTRITYPDGTQKIQYFIDEDSSAIVANVPPGIAYSHDELISEGLKQRESSTFLNKVRYEYNGLKNLMKVKQYTHGLNEPYFWIAFTYNSLGLRTGSIDMNGRTTGRKYDQRGRLIELVREDQSKVEIDYEDAKRISTYIDEEGFRTKIQRDVMDRTKKIWRELDKGLATYYGTCFEHDGVGNVIKIENGIEYNFDGSIRDTSGKEIFTREYNGFDELVREIDPEREAVDNLTGENLGLRPIVTEYETLFSDGLKVERRLSPNNVLDNKELYETTYRDANDNVVKTVSPLGYEAVQHHNAYGERIRETDPEGHSRYYTYNKRGLVEIERDDENNYIRHEYDGIGNVIRQGYGKYNPDTDSYKEKYHETFEYDALSRLIRQSFPDGTSIIYSYDKYGNKTSEIDRGGRKTEYGYDKRNRLIWQKSPSGVYTYFEYDKRGQKTKEIDNAGRANLFSYNGLGQTVEYQNRVNKKIHLAYDQIGRRISRTEGDIHGNIRNTTEYSYLKGTELAERITIAGEGKTDEVQRLAYDANGNLCIDNRNGVMSFYHYDEDDRLIAENDSADISLSVLYSYYKNGLLKSRTERSGKRFENFYDGANRLAAAHSYGAGDSSPADVVAYEYNFKDQITEAARTGSTSFARTYAYDDATGYLVQEVFGFAGNMYTTRYEYTKGGEIERIKYPGSSAWIKYTYDQAGRMKGVGGITQDQGFIYNNLDLIQTLSFASDRQVSYEYDDYYRTTGITLEDRSAGGAIWRLENEYDCYGNVLSQKQAGSFIEEAFQEAEREIRYTYDFRHRLKAWKTETEDTYRLTHNPSDSVYIPRDFYVDEDYDQTFYEALNSQGSGNIGIDLLDTGTEELIGYYPEAKASTDPLTSREEVAVDSQGSSLILDLGKQVEGVKKIYLYASIYEQEGTSVSLKQDLSQNYERLNEYNIVVKYSLFGHYEVIPSESAKESGYGGTTWNLVKDETTGHLEICFSEPVSTDTFKLYFLIDERKPALYCDYSEETSYVKNPIARDAEDYFRNTGNFINSVFHLAEVEYEVKGKKEVLYTYDANSNRQGVTTKYFSESVYEEVSSTYEYQTGTNRMISDGVYRYEYDADGNVAKKANDYIEYVYEWDVQNRLSGVYLKLLRRGWHKEWEQFLTEVELNELLLIFEARYDEQSRRYYKKARQKDGTWEETYSVYTEGGLLYKKEMGEETEEKSYVYGNGLKLAEIEGTMEVGEKDAENTVIGFASGVIRYVVSDQLGSTRLLVGGEGEVLWYSGYAPFGESMDERGVGGVTTDETFTSYTRDIETGLYYAQHRYYDPSLGRFLSPDPAKDGENWYVYAGNNPLRFVDPTGLVILPLIAPQKQNAPYNTRRPLGTSQLSVYQKEVAPGKYEARPNTVSRMGCLHTAVVNVGNTYNISFKKHIRSFFTHDPSTRWHTGYVYASDPSVAANPDYFLISDQNVTQIDEGKLAESMEHLMAGRFVEAFRAKMEAAEYKKGKRVWSMPESLVEGLTGEEWAVERIEGSKSSQEAIKEWANNKNESAYLIAQVPSKSGSGDHWINVTGVTIDRKGNITDFEYFDPASGEGGTDYKSEDVTGLYVLEPPKQEKQRENIGERSEKKEEKEKSGAEKERDKIICLELYRQGLMAESIFEADEAFGRWLRENRPDVLAGYRVFAGPVVELMRESRVFTKVVNIVVGPWSYEMAYRMGEREEGDVAGAIIMWVGVPVCGFIGKMVNKGIGIEGMVGVVVVILLMLSVFMGYYVFYVKRKRLLKRKS